MTALVTPRAEPLPAVQEMSIEDLRREYISLKSTSYSLSVEESHLKNKIEVLREESVRAEFNAEVKEEQVSNQLFRRLDGAEKEVQRYKSMLREEESEAETLTARIKAMRKEKNEVENTLEERQEYLLLNLQRQLLETARRKTAVEQELMLERQRYLDVLVNRLDMLRGRSTVESSEASLTPRPATETTIGTPLPQPPPTKSNITEDTGTSASTAPASAAPSSSLTTPPAPPPPPSNTSLVSGHEAALPPAPLQAPGGRVSQHNTPRSGDLTPMSSHSSETHHAVVELENKLNQLLMEQNAAMQRSSATEKQCAELGAKLRAVQEVTFLDRARAARLKEEIADARTRLAEADSTGPVNASMVGDASFDDSFTIGASFRSMDLSVSMSMSNLSLRERTRELLSSIPPSSMN